jgi:UDP-N-acetylmuramate dehydrogenase
MILNGTDNIFMNIQENVKLAPCTTMKIGGPAKFFVEVGSEEEMVEALSFAKKNKLDFFILGGGSNIIVSDQGFNGLVIRMQSSAISDQKTENNKKGIWWNEGKVECWAGESLASVINFAKENNLTGMEWAAGIPGTIGGAIRGNAGAYGSDMSALIDNVKAMEMLDDNFSNSDQAQNQKIFNKAACKFSYRDSIFKQNKNLIILSCALSLEKGDRLEIENRSREIVKKRVEKLPKGFSAGSFFQNPVVENQELIKSFEKESGAKVKDSIVPAGWLIEEAGFLGKKIGGVRVSEKHANFFINDGTGTAEDVIILAGIIKQKMREGYGIQIKEEIMYVGF